MDIKDLKENNKKNNKEALKTYCDVLLVLRDMQGTENLRKSKSEKDAVINHIIAFLIREATDSAHPFGYSDSRKIAAQYISEKAWVQLIKNDNAEGLIGEHIIPIGVLKEYIFEHWAKWRCDELIDCFRKFTVTAIVTKEDDAQLKKAGVHSSMPEGCSIKDDMSEDGKFSRYKYADIKLRSLVTVENDRKVVVNNLRKLAKNKNA